MSNSESAEQTNKPQPENKMKSWKEFTHFAALDWAKDHHDVVVVDRQGTVVADFASSQAEDSAKDAPYLSSTKAPGGPRRECWPTPEGFRSQLSVGRCMPAAVR